MAAAAEGIPDRVISEMPRFSAGRSTSPVRSDPGRRSGSCTKSYDASTAPGRPPGACSPSRSRTVASVTRRSTSTRRADAVGAYYNRSGEALGRYFLRYPVEFTRISSRFSERRFHTRCSRRPSLTTGSTSPPRRHAGQGHRRRQDRKAGWHGGNGRFIKIEHDGVYESGYAHLSRIDTAVKPGSHVRKGQIIGYVGATGLATGPHLHLALYQRGKYVDPLTSELPRAQPLTGDTLASFRHTVDEIDRAYVRADGDDDRLAGVAPGTRPN